MASGGTSPKGLSAALNRLEGKFESISSQIEQLDEGAQKLSQRLERHRQTLEHQARLDQVWMCLMEDRLTAVEKNLLFTYTIDTLRRCHSLTLEKLPDLAHALPTVASVLRATSKNRRIRAAWESVLGDLGLDAWDIDVLCVFSVTQGYRAEYYAPSERQRHAGVEALLRKAVDSDVLRESLLRAVRAAEKEKARNFASDKPALSVREQLGNKIPKK
ncbi:single-pass membrane and coiled-coil domain-containing protein 1-like [Scleropages formosus]|uniref:Single-pass membrane protein with coiled-coil domains 1 n=1 Tax=Scleropages formosus TaxID=113540 RepID=A0A8C9RPW8_SCLFO|nr:single-pass membrane and coiled-coil domain-containing protein 1 [Scleropages formosus]